MKLEADVAEGDRVSPALGWRSVCFVATQAVMLWAGAVVVLFGDRSWNLFAYRRIQYRAGLDALDAGLPLMTGLTPDKMPFRLGIGDDPGFFLFGQLAYRLLGVSSPDEALRLLFFVLLLGSLVSTMLVTRRLWKGPWLPLIVGLLVANGSRPAYGRSAYFVPFFAALILLPIIWSLALAPSRTMRFSAAVRAAGLVGLLAGLFGLFRSHTALVYVVITAALVVTRLHGNAVRRVAVGALIAAPYLAMVTVPVRVVSDVRDGWFREHPTKVQPESLAACSEPSGRLAATNFEHIFCSSYRADGEALVWTGWSAAIPSHPFWHSAYIGFGFLPNPYGIFYSDTVALEAALARDRDTVYFSVAHERHLRHAFFAVLRADPGFALNTYAQKAVLVSHRLLSPFWFIPLWLLALRRVQNRATWQRTRTLVSVTGVAGVFAAAAPVLTLPDHDYELGAAATMLALFIVLLAVSLDSLPSIVRLVKQRGRAWRERCSLFSGVARRRGFVVGGFGALLALAPVPALSVAVDRLELKDKLQHATYAPPVRARPQDARLIGEYSGAAIRATFASVDKATFVGSAPAALVVKTGRLPNGYQLMSPPFALCAGTYQLELDAHVVEGGMSIGLLDEPESSFLGSTKLSHRVRTSPTLSGPIVVSTDQTVKIVLSNWRGAAKPSIWSLRSVKLFRLDGGPEAPCS